MVLAAAYIYFTLYLPTAIPDGAEPVRFEIERGERLQSISDRLHQLGLVQHPVSLKLAAFLFGGGTSIKAGKHEIPFGLHAVELLELLKQSPLKEFRVLTVPEGWDVFEIGAELERLEMATKAELLELASDAELLELAGTEADSLEGFLFPDTYHVPVDYSPRQIVRMMIKRGTDVLNDEVEKAFNSKGLSLIEGITLASLVAKEAGNTEEMPLISSVFHNRLERDMKLECDPTFIYAAKMEGAWDGVAHRSDIVRQHPYNTYLHTGLPPGPIGNPGQAAIEAALNPAVTDYIFFVAKSADQSEGHLFARTLREHNANVREYRQARAAAQ